MALEYYIFIVIHPKNDNIVYVAALGHTFGPQKERGIYKTTNGGKTWKQILFIDEKRAFFQNSRSFICRIACDKTLND